MSAAVNRRHFLISSAAAATALSPAYAHSPSNKIVVGVMGTGGRGTYLAETYAKQEDVVVEYVCDVDRKRAEGAAGKVEKATGTAPKAVQDFRKVLDDKSVDVLVVATSNHWHAPGAILGCAAGKHVYVEKPCSHNPREGELLVEAARKHQKLVQMGNQRRTWPKIVEAMQLVREGAIGRAYLAQSYYYNSRDTIGRGKEAAVPEGLDYDLWQGPAPRRPFKDNYLHYNWHWFWNWGNGELGNNGIHMLDLRRWGLGVNFPIRVTSSGGRYRFDDDQETPDTHLVCFEFPGKKSVTWEGLSCNQTAPGKGFDVIFFGEQGTLVIAGSGYTLFDAKNKEVKKESGEGGDVIHINNFLDSVRGKSKLTSEIEDGHKSTLLCHLGNIAHRTGRTIGCDPNSGHILDDKEAMGYWSREYAKGFEPKV